MPEARLLKAEPRFAGGWLRQRELARSRRARYAGIWMSRFLGLSKPFASPKPRKG